MEIDNEYRMQNIIIEHTSKSLWDKNIIYYLKYIGYIEIFKTRDNTALKLIVK